MSTELRAHDHDQTHLSAHTHLTHGLTHIYAGAQCVCVCVCCVSTAATFQLRAPAGLLFLVSNNESLFVDTPLQGGTRAEPNYKHLNSFNVDLQSKTTQTGPLLDPEPKAALTFVRAAFGPEEKLLRHSSFTSLPLFHQEELEEQLNPTRCRRTTE